MNKEILEGNWEILKGKLKQKWGKLTDDDLKEIEGDRQILFGKLQSKYGYTKEEAEKYLEDL